MAASRRLRFAMLVLFSTIVLVACGADDVPLVTGVPTADSDGAGTSTRTSDLPLQQNFADPSEMRRFRVDGAEALARSTFESLPERAMRVEFSSMVLDQGDGPMGCFGGNIDDSFPPQCSGPIVDGLEPDPSWSRSTDGVTWGERTVVVTWPPTNGRVELVDERPFEAVRRRDPSPGDTEATPAELEAVRSELDGLLDADGVHGIGTRSDHVFVLVSVADLESIRAITMRVSRPDLLSIEATGAIVG